MANSGGTSSPLRVCVGMLNNKLEIVPSERYLEVDWFSLGFGTTAMKSVS